LITVLVYFFGITYRDNEWIGVGSHLLIELGMLLGTTRGLHDDVSRDQSSTKEKIELTKGGYNHRIGGGGGRNQGGSLRVLFPLSLSSWRAVWFLMLLLSNFVVSIPFALLDVFW
jgi:hypothetical protein